MVFSRNNKRGHPRRGGLWCMVSSMSKLVDHSSWTDLIGGLVVLVILGLGVVGFIVGGIRILMGLG